MGQVEVDTTKLKDLDVDHESMKPARASPLPSGVHGNPLPMGLLSFSLTCMMLMFIISGWAEGETLNSIIIYAACVGGIGHLLTCIFEMIKGNTFAATVFFSYGGFWGAFAMMNYLAKTATFINPALFPIGQTLIYVTWGILSVVFLVPTLRMNRCLITIFTLLVVTFFLLAGSIWSKSCVTAAGYFGLACGGSAFYTAVAVLYHDLLGFTAPGLQPVQYI